MSLHRGIDGSEPVRPEPIGRVAGPEEVRRLTRTRPVAYGTLACPACDAPVSPGPHGLGPAQPLGCPYCGHAARVRDFLSLGSPTRPARVVVRLAATPRRAPRAALRPQRP